MTQSRRPDHELDAPPWQRVEATLMATSRALREAYNLRLSQLDLKLGQASVLALLEQSGPMVQTQIANRLNVGRAAIGASIDTLEKRGCVERRADPTDRRAKLVAITQKGSKLVEPITEQDRGLRQGLRRGITRAERHQLASLLLRLQANLADELNENDDD